MLSSCHFRWASRSALHMVCAVGRAHLSHRGPKIVGKVWGSWLTFSGHFGCLIGLNLAGLIFLVSSTSWILLEEYYTNEPSKVSFFSKFHFLFSCQFSHNWPFSALLFSILSDVQQIYSVYLLWISCLADLLKTLYFGLYFVSLCAGTF